ncbi:MAG: hypothetical protein IJF29_03220 [Firmicutes bacterium]|nr:hypothetical protein [Bacillota bacterium]
MEKVTTTEIWDKYERGRSFLRQADLTGRTERNYRFYTGDQWHGIETGGEELPMANFIKPIIRYKVATVCKKSMTAVFVPDDRLDSQADAAARALNRLFALNWELAKMDTVVRQMIKDGAIAGDSYLFFGEGDDVIKSQMIDNVNIFFGDEKENDIQQQPYIIIRERRFVKDIRKEAEENGIKNEQELALIVADTDTEDELGDKTDIEYDEDEGKCVSLLYLYRDDDGYIHTMKSVKNLIYQKDRAVSVVNTDEDGDEIKTGLKMYPIVNFIWEEKKGSARGVSEVEYLIPNQLEVNKTLARRALTVKNVSYPKTVVNSHAIRNIDDIYKAGAVIEVDDANVQGINNIIGYLNATSVAPDAKNLSDELMINSRELAGAGDAATGAIDPTKASGTAIIAVRDQSALPLNEQMARLRQFVEDVALLWFDLWRAYNPDGIKERLEDGEIEITGEELESLKPSVFIEVTDRDAYSRYAEEQTIGELFGRGVISFEEYVSLLRDDSIVPKAKLMEIIEKRKAGGENNEMQKMSDGNAQGQS